jgi:hypothetical protein
MKFKTAVRLAGALTVPGFFGVSEVLSYRKLRSSSHSTSTMRCCLKIGSDGSDRATSQQTTHRRKPFPGDPGVAVRGAVSLPSRAAVRSAADSEGTEELADRRKI